MNYDIAVIGGGPGGYSAAFEAVKQGLKVIMFEQADIGGVCLNRGCVPTKFLLHTGELAEELSRISAYGITAAASTMDMAKTQQENYKIVDDLRKGLYERIAGNNITIVPQRAAIISSNQVKAGDDIYEASNIIIATGSAYTPPLVKGAVSGDELLKTNYIPPELTIIGGGIVAVEFASIFSSLGSKVTIKIRGERLLRKMDKELAAGAAQILRKKSAKILAKCTQEDFERDNAEVVLSAVGRIPVLPEIQNISPVLGEDGGIVTDNFCMTSVSGIYAVGDVTANSPKLAHTAMEQGRRAAQHIAGVALPPPSAVISCIYTRPEIASAGLSETDAKAMGIDCVTAKQTMYSNARTLIANPERGFVKIVAESVSGRIIGAQLMCERGGDIIAEAALAINNKLTVYDLCQTAHPHPSFCEAVFEAAELLKNKLEQRKESSNAF